MHSRKNPRIEVDYTVTFTGDQVSGKGTLTNLTITGAEIRSSTDCPLDAHLCLSIQSSGARPPIVITLAVVRWKEGGRSGVEFVRFEGHSKQQLEDMLNQHDISPPS
jgi:hypothetical protein